MTILHIEDDPTTAKSVQLMLGHQNFEVQTSDMGEEGLELVRANTYDLILLDINLPDISGLEVLKMLRREGNVTPVMMLTGRDDTQSKITAFGYGADDYLCKPFHRDELVARIRAILRRPRVMVNSIIKVGPFHIDTLQKKVTVDDIGVFMKDREYALLEVLAQNKGAVLTNVFIHDHIYRGEAEKPGLDIIDRLVCRLRQRLSHAFDRNIIETHWTQGYRLDDPRPSQLTTSKTGWKTGGTTGEKPE